MSDDLFRRETTSLEAAQEVLARKGADTAEVRAAFA